MKPARYSREPHCYEPMRARLNLALAFAGLVVDESGELKSADVAQTLPETQRRARDLRADLEGRGVHHDALKFYRAELLAENYFHAVQEAVKSVADKMRSQRGLSDDGALLIDRTLRQSAGACDQPAIHRKRTERAKRVRKSGPRHLRHVPQPHCT